MYLYRLHIPKAALNLPLDVFAAQQKEENLAYFCSQPALEPFGEIGVSFKYNYWDSDKQYLFSVYSDPASVLKVVAKVKLKDSPTKRLSNKL